MSQFIDHVFIEVRSGDGGNGIVAWRREKYEPMGGPAGGNGGRGGHIYFEATRDINTLIDFRFKKRIEARVGERGRNKGMHGKNAEDTIVRVPVGTVIKDAETGDIIADLVLDHQRAMVAQGGRGGRGNTMLSSPQMRAPHFCEPGEAGIERKLELELKVLADIGVIGLPNAGKSTLLSVVSAAKPKIADYPFSTLEPQLGVIKTKSGNAFVMADIPGLVEGASEGVGLGHQFLRHVERTRMLIHLVDITSEHLEDDIDTIRAELRLHSEDLAALPQLLVCNKADLVDQEEAASIIERLKKHYKTADNKKQNELFKGEEVMLISGATREGVDSLINVLENALMKLKADQPEPAEIIFFDPKSQERPDNGFQIYRKKGLFIVEGDRAERLVSVTNMRDPDSIHHMIHVLRAMGIIDALIAEGAKAGSEVVVGATTFSFGEEFN
ncbi:MAG: GTPase ObgE [Candidatus Melainabacteria bacterium]|nr:GTPase ObgE [Candidatus Melainabacteria bacterium]